MDITISKFISVFTVRYYHAQSLKISDICVCKPVTFKEVENRTFFRFYTDLFDKGLSRKVLHGQQSWK